jgi:hypothetical protein
VNSPGVKKGLKLTVDHKLKRRFIDSKFHGPRSPTGKQQEQHDSQRPHVEFKWVKRGRCLGGIQNFGGPVERWPAPARPRVSCSNFHLLKEEKDEANNFNLSNEKKIREKRYRDTHHVSISTPP